MFFVAAFVLGLGLIRYKSTRALLVAGKQAPSAASACTAMSSPALLELAAAAAASSVELQENTYAGAPSAASA
jgi:hypothetical protein